VKRHLQRELEAIARDRVSGAAELAGRAATALIAWLRAGPARTSDQLLEAARIVRDCQPQMAPFFRLANEMALAAGHASPGVDAITRVRRFARTIRAAKLRIARHFARALPQGKHLLATYTYSSTVAAALVAARRKILGLYCSESRPKMEGRRLATELNAAGVHTVFCSDAVLLSVSGLWTHLVLGADTITPRFLVNKVGSALLSKAAQERRATAWILADTLKFVPSNQFAHSEVSHAADEDRSLWPGAPDGILRLPTGLESFPLHPSMRFVTEHGVWSLSGVRRFLKAIPLSTRIETFVN
jgi:translation initiation factor 2B subunit (eIF-2B alpha/beta/delta family)